MSKKTGAAGWIFSLLCPVMLLGGCATRYPVLPAEWAQIQKVELAETPFFPQQTYQCGPASLASVLQQSGIRVTPDALSRQVYLPQRQGSLQLELIGASRRNGRIPYRLPPNLSAIASELRQGRPVLVLQNLGLRSLPVWHYAVVTGVDPASSELILHSGTKRSLRVDAQGFLRTWDLANRWGIVVLKPGELPADDNPVAFLKAVAAYHAVTNDTAVSKSYAQAVRRWPQNHLTWFSLAVDAQKSGNQQPAMQHYQQALKLKPDHLPSINNLSLLYAQKKLFEQSLKLLDAGLSLAPQSSFVSQLLTTRKEILRMRTQHNQ